MDEAAARAELEIMVQADIDPVLTEVDVDTLMARARRVDRAGNSPRNVTTADAWAASTGYLAGDVIVVDGRWWRCLVPGTSAATEPTWPLFARQPVTETRVADGDVLWVDNGLQWEPTYDLHAAARMGWRLKAGKVANAYSFQTDGQTFQRQQMIQHCLAMAEQHRPRGVGSVRAG